MTIKNAEQSPGSVSISVWTFFLERHGSKTKTGVPHIYSLYAFESLQNSSLEISKMLNKLLLIYISFISAAADRRTSLLSAYSFFMTMIRRNSSIKTKSVDFLKVDMLADANGLYTDEGT